MGSTDRRWTRGPSRAGLMVISAVAVACGPEPFVEEGSTFGKSQSFEIDAGTHAISWSAWDAAPPVDGCLFGLLLDPEDLGSADELEPPIGFDLPKLAYQVLDGGDALNGRIALELPGVGTGSSWRARAPGASGSIGTDDARRSGHRPGLLRIRQWRA